MIVKALNEEKVPKL